MSAIKPVYANLDGMLVNILKDFRLNPLATSERILLGNLLSSANVGLCVFDTTLNQFFFWGGSNWIVSGGGGSSIWGSITGNINDQTDLQNEFNTLQSFLQGEINLKANISSLATVAFSGSYTDLSNKPTIPPGQIQSDWNQSNISALDYIKNKPTIPAAQVNSDWNAISGVAQILNKPTIYSFTGTSAQYTKGDGTYATFPTALSAFTNDVGYITASSTATLTNKSGNISQWTNDSGYLTGITSEQVTTALGYTPVPNSRTLTINGTTFDLTANRTWTVSASPGGSNTQVQFNNSGSFGGSGNFVWDNTNSILTVVGQSLFTGISLDGTVASGAQMRVPTNFILKAQPTPDSGGNSIWFQSTVPTGNSTGQSLFFFMNPMWSPGAGSNGTWACVALNPNINQAVGATGVSRGLWIVPTLTAVTDFRALEVTTGKSIFAPSTTTSCSINIPTGVAPTSPNEGDIWKDATHLFIRLNGVTVTIV